MAFCSFDPFKLKESLPKENWMIKKEKINTQNTFMTSMDWVRNHTSNELGLSLPNPLDQNFRK